MPRGYGYARGPNHSVLCCLRLQEEETKDEDGVPVKSVITYKSLNHQEAGGLKLTLSQTWLRNIFLLGHGIALKLSTFWGSSAGWMSLDNMPLDKHAK